MRKSVLILIASVLLLTSCGTYTGDGMANGAFFGSMIGSMIGGISDGRRGSDIGGLIGMAGGAVVGAVIGSAADEAAAREREEYIRDRELRRHRMNDRTTRGNDDMDQVTPADEPVEYDDYFDPTNSGDDRITFDNDTTAVLPPPPASYDAPAPYSHREEGIVIRHALFRDANGDKVLVAGEECTVTFEILNRTHRPVYDIQPLVYDVMNNKNIHISQNLRVERIMPGKGIRYTATIKADRKLRNGQARIRVGVMQGNVEIDGQTREFLIETRKR